MRLPAVVKALNSEETRMKAIRQREAIKKKSMKTLTTNPGRAIGLQESRIGSAAVRFLY